MSQPKDIDSAVAVPASPPRRRQNVSLENATTMSSVPASIPRRHDLDALRAIAMLLGIALHGAIAYIPAPPGVWPVIDVRQDPAYALFFGVIHGFRMPLFFLISGFFTAMMWRKRGLSSLLKQRFKRIFLPLVIGTFTFVPAVWIVSIAVGVAGATSIDTSADANLWNAARLGNIEAIEQHVMSGATLSDLDPALGATPITMAAWGGQAETIRWLVEAGADVKMRNRDGTTSLHAAALLGRTDAAEALIELGIEKDAIDKRGHHAAEVMTTQWFATEFVAGMIGVPVTQREVTDGREKISRLLVSAQPNRADTQTAVVTDTDENADANSIAQDATDENATGANASDGKAAGENIASESGKAISVPTTKPAHPDPGSSLQGVLLLLMVFPLFHHLWFLWFLCWLVAAFALYALVVGSTGWQAPNWIVATPVRYLWLIPLTLIPQVFMGVQFPAFGPDTSPGLLPIPMVLLYYAIFFFFGAMYFDSDDTSGELGRRWRWTLPIALLLVFPIGYEFAMGGLGFGDWIDYYWHRPLAIVLQVTFAWMMTFGLMGMFRGLCSRESRAMRYMSDASYWLYLAHLPLIIFAQALVRNWQVPSFAKFGLVCTTTSLLLLASYQWLVRYTPIGTLLNGPRTRPQTGQDSLQGPPPSANPERT